MDRVTRFADLDLSLVAQLPKLPSTFDPSIVNVNNASALIPVKYFWQDDGRDVLRVADGINMTNLTNAYLWSTTPGRVIDEQALHIVHRCFMLHHYAYHGFFKPSLDEILWQMPRELLGRQLFVLVEGPRDAQDLNVTWAACKNTEYHVSRVSFFDPVVNDAPPSYEA